MTDHQFREGQRVWHRQRREYGIYIKQDWIKSESIVAFPRGHVAGFPAEDEECRVTTAQLVPADEADA